MKNLFSSSLIVAMLSVSMVASAASDTEIKPDFSDVKESNGYAQSIGLLQQLGVVKGNPDGTFAPTRVLNRAEFVKIIVISSDKDPETEPSAKCFEDVDLKQWFTKYVCRAKELGYVKGDNNEGKIFRPAEELNMAEILAVLSRAYKWDAAAPKAGEQWFTPYFTHAKAKNLLDKTYDAGHKVPRGLFAEITGRSMTVNRLKLNKFDSASDFHKLLKPMTGDMEKAPEMETKPKEEMGSKESSSTGFVPFASKFGSVRNSVNRSAPKAPEKMETPAASSTTTKTPPVLKTPTFRAPQRSQ